MEAKKIIEDLIEGASYTYSGDERDMTKGKVYTIKKVEEDYIELCDDYAVDGESNHQFSRYEYPDFELVPNQAPTLMEKQGAISSFRRYFDLNKQSYNLLSSTSYKFGDSHDGIIFWNEHSNSFGFDELLLIKSFCDDNDYSFSCFTRKTDNVSGYGGVSIQINICR